MSNSVTSLAKRRIVGSSARKAVLMYMADNASDDGSGIWTSKRNMALDLEMSRRTVQSHIQAMMETGLVVEVGQRKCANGYTVEYGIDLAVLMVMPCTRAGDAPVQEMHPYPRSTCTPTGAGDAPKPPLEPPIEPPVDNNAGAKAKARLPENWTPTDDDIEYALSLKLNQGEIKEIADDFHAYWTDRTDAGGKKSERGWRQTWRNRCRDVAGKFIRNRSLVGGQITGGYRQGGSIASVVARRQSGGSL